MFKYDSFRPIKLLNYLNEINEIIKVIKLLKKPLFFNKYKNEWKNINFGDKKIKKCNFCRNKTLLKIDDINLDEILVSKKEPYSTNK